MSNSNAYGLLVETTKAIVNQRGRSWDSLSPVEQGEHIAATRAGLAVIHAHYQAKGYGMRTKCMRDLIDATEGMPAGEARAFARQFFNEIANGGGRTLSADDARRVVLGLDTPEGGELED